MSAEWRTQVGESWRLSLPCSRAEAEALMALDAPLDDGDEPAPVLMVSEADANAPDAWRIDVYSEGAPSADLITRLHALAPSAGGQAPAVERLEDADWVRLSQAWLEPIRAGRFFVHTSAYLDRIPPDAIAFRIEASRAFGTGHHETTAGCLAQLDRLASSGRRFSAVVDIGTGTGLLALAAHALWPEAAILASDIDPVAIEVAAGNLAVNGLPAGAIGLTVADGVDASSIAEAGPFDLLIANILAGPLIALALDFARVVQPGGTVMLAGLLAGQEAAVLDAFVAAGFTPVDRLVRGDWPTLVMLR